LIETLRQLIRLQAVDSDIQAIEERKEDAPQRIRELEEQLNQLNEKIEGQRQRQEELRQKRADVESQMEEIRGKIGKSQSKLSQVKNDREYRATLKEIDEFKRLMKLTEEDTISVMEEQESVEKTIAENENLLESEKKVIEEEMKVVEEALQKADSELEVFEGQKQELVKGIDARTLSKYDFIRKNRNGIAIAGVTKGLCTACHMNLPPQFFNELMKTDTLLTCPNCHRIIYWMDHEVFAEPSEEAAAENE